jgi:hypothetical protein
MFYIYPTIFEIIKKKFIKCVVSLVENEWADFNQFSILYRYTDF